MVGRICLLVLLLALSSPGLAQVLGNERVSSRLSHQQIGLDETATLTITVKGLNDVVDIPAPTVRPGQGLQIVSMGRQFSMTSVNGVTQTSTDFNFLVTPLQKGRYVIQPINVNVNGVDHPTSSHRLEVSGVMSYNRRPSTNPWNNPNLPPAFNRVIPPSANTTQRRPRGEDVVLEAEIEPSTVYVHEPVIHTFRFLTAVTLLNSPKRPPISPTGFLSVPLEQEVVEEYRQGRDYLITESGTALFPLTEGEFTIPPFEIPLATGFFGRTRMLRTEEKTITVLPLPKEDQPLSFTGAVGEWFDMQATVNRTRLKAGQTLELKVDVEGEGHLDLVPYPYLPDWDNVDKRQQDGSSMVEVTKEGGVQSKRTYLFRLKFKEPGTYPLKDITFAYFRPSKEHYEVLKAPELVVTVSPGQEVPDEADPSKNGLPEKDRPASDPGPQTPTETHIPQTHFLAGLVLALLGLGFGGLNSRPKLDGIGHLFRGFGKPKNLAQLKSAMNKLAPGPDSLMRKEQLSELGWNDQAIRRFEELSRLLSSTQYGSDSPAVSTEQLLEDFLTLQKEARQ